MKHVHFVRHTASVVLAIGSSLLGFAIFAPSAFALMVRLRTPTVEFRLSAGTSPVSQPDPTVGHAVVTGGMAGWLITLIAVGAALLAATVAVFMDRARATHRRLTVPAP